MSVEAKWKANQDKVAFLKTFPGLLNSWEQTAGRTLEHIVPIASKSGAAVLVFSDGTFLVAESPIFEPRELTEGLLGARSILEQNHPEGFAEYDRLNDHDKEAGRIARLENIIGAIQNNLEQIPELKDRIRSLAREWDS